MYTIQDIKEIVESEGLGYAIEDYLETDQIKDEELKRAWKQAEEALDKIRTILEYELY